MVFDNSQWGTRKESLLTITALRFCLKLAYKIQLSHAPNTVTSSLLKLLRGNNKTSGILHVYSNQIQKDGKNLDYMQFAEMKCS